MLRCEQEDTHPEYAFVFCVASCQSNAMHAMEVSFEAGRLNMRDHAITFLSVMSFNHGISSRRIVLCGV
jgi:hypothetical protein